MQHLQVADAENPVSLVVRENLALQPGALRFNVLHATLRIVGFNTLPELGQFPQAGAVIALYEEVWPVIFKKAFPGVNV
jgi:hypothetical protein